MLAFALLTIVTFAQNTRVYSTFYEVFICKNPNGVVETLLATQDISTGKIGFIYRSSKRPNVDIPLSIVSNQDNEVFVVNFPNDTKPYKLETCAGCQHIICTNPDGSVQKFNLDFDLWGNRGTFRCINPDKTIEYLRIEGSSRNLKVKYSSSKNPKWVNLKVSNINSGDMDNIKFFDVQFPNDKKNYRIEAFSIGFGYFCWLPNGGQQTFQWINK